MQYCTKCVYPASTGVPISFHESGVCSGCRSADQRIDVDWSERGDMYRELLEEHRSQDGSNYDCLIPVSGGKDSYFQIHVITKIYGLRPLLVTYNANNWMPVGIRNLERMRDVFGCDHIFFTPSIDTLKKMNRLGFKLTGDMNWHYHAGILTYPVRVAVQHKVPLLIWGEHGWTDLVGMYSLDDFPEMNFKLRTEHGLRGYDWHDFTDDGLAKLGRPELTEGLTKQDLIWSIYPSDEELMSVGVRGVYMNFYHRWEANEHLELMKELYGFEELDEPFDRTYRRGSNLDDMHENGIHDYLKFIKFGYGRCSDHVCKDIRAGLLTREEGIELVRKYDSVKPRDLYRWLEYVGMDEEEFVIICDTFRDPAVWSIENNEWIKDNIWGEKSGYGEVSLPPNDPGREKYY